MRSTDLDTFYVLSFFIYNAHNRHTVYFEKNIQVTLNLSIPQMNKHGQLISQFKKLVIVIITIL